ncbi:hypothetical protein [Nocardia sienata]|uniref:hypothetical protein n=1 Tax=Nocardia sienata TaxID=248552 RepID=UPI000AF82478|nr:hypothetical protein [Nocardia sienata]
MYGRRGFGPLPDSRAVSAVFARAAEFRTAGAADFGCPILVSVAGLVDAHRRLAATRPNWDEVAMTWIPGRSEPELPGMDLAADPFTGAWEDAQRHLLVIDLEAHRVLGEPGSGAVEHHEGLGAVFGRLAYLYTISFDRYILDGPQAAHRRQLARAYFSYESLARELACGEKCLPPPAGGPAAESGDR